MLLGFTVSKVTTLPTIFVTVPEKVFAAGEQFAVTTHGAVAEEGNAVAIVMEVPDTFRIAASRGDPLSNIKVSLLVPPETNPTPEATTSTVAPELRFVVVLSFTPSMFTDIV
jgi:hypothetical protein